MTRAQREAVIKLLPVIANKTYCLDAQTDVDDPIGKGMEAYLNCARRIHDLVRLRLDELNLKAA
jgi:protein-tyrosine-phosphatase